MKWGIVFSSTTCPDPDSAAALAENAEEAGFESLWAPEHIVVPVEYEPIYAASPTGRMDRLGRRGGIPDPIVWFAYVAARTTRLRFGTGVVILPEHNVVTFAKSCATLAVLSKGRFILGCGVGWNREEYEALGMPWDHRGARYDECIWALRTLWRDPEPSYDGVYVKFPPVECDPKPPGGSIPIVLGGTSRPAVRRAGQLGDGYFPAIFPTERVHEELPKLVSLLRSSAEEAGPGSRFDRNHLRRCPHRGGGALVRGPRSQPPHGGGSGQDRSRDARGAAAFRRRGHRHHDRPVSGWNRTGRRGSHIDDTGDR